MSKFVLVQRRGHTLVPADPYSYEALESFPEGKALNLELKTSRSRGELNLYWAGLSLLRESAFSEDDDIRWPTTRAYHNSMLRRLGYTEKLWQHNPKSPSGCSFTVEVNSVALDNMQDDEFKTLFERVRQLTVEAFAFDPWDEWLKIRGSDWQTHWGRNWRPGDKDE